MAKHDDKLFKMVIITQMITTKQYIQ